MTEQLPPPDTAAFPALESAHVRVLPAGALLGRIHAQSGPNPSHWNEFRHLGPTSARFDHHPPPRAHHPDRGILYAAPALPDATGEPMPVLRTCIAECFRDRGTVELSRGQPSFVLFRIVAPLRLLDLADSIWVTQAGGNAAISSGLRTRAREWSRAIYGHYRGADELHGIHYGCSTIPPARSVALFERALDALPRRPALHRPLNDPALRPEVEVYATQLRLDLLP